MALKTDMMKKFMSDGYIYETTPTKMPPHQHIRHLYFLFLVDISDISLTVTDSRSFLFTYHKHIRLLSCLRQSCEQIIHKYISHLRYGSAQIGDRFDRSQLVRPALSH